MRVAVNYDIIVSGADERLEKIFLFTVKQSDSDVIGHDFSEPASNLCGLYFGEPFHQQLVVSVVVSVYAYQSCLQRFQTRHRERGYVVARMQHEVHVLSIEAYYGLVHEG
jgi:hypothetical protein